VGVGETTAMKLSYTDLQTLQRAADVADAQRELVRQAKHTKAERISLPASDPLMVASIVAIFLLSLLTFTSLT
jgi:hypothetical protein